MELIASLLGKGGLVFAVGIAAFLFTYKYSVGIFDWFERQTLGTRTFILEKCDLLMMDIKSDHITYGLLGMSLGLGSLITVLLGFGVNWVFGLIVGGLVTFFSFKIPKPIFNYMVGQRIIAYQNQMVDGLTLLSNGLRAGLSVPQSISMVVDEMPAPISEEFNVILQQNKIGVPLEECFENLSKRMPTEDNDMFVSSVNILRETGGNLAETFDTIIAVIRERIRIKQKIDTLTATGLFQGYTIAAMPFAIGGIFASSDPKGFSMMIGHPVGIAMIIVAIISDAIGLFIIMKIVKIKI
jgi:tight adherence protein B